MDRCIAVNHIFTPTCFCRAEADEVRGRPPAGDPPAQQHAAQKLRLPAGQEAAAGEGAQAAGGEHSGVRPEEAAREETGGEPARGHQGKIKNLLHKKIQRSTSKQTLTFLRFSCCRI